MAIELATGYVSIVPSAKGIKKNLEAEVLGPTEDTGKKAAESFGKRFTSGMKSVGKTAAAAFTATIAAGLAVGGGLVAIGKQFDQAFDTIKIGTGATGEALQGLKEDFKAVVRDVPTDFNTAAAALTNLNTLTGATGDTLSTLTARVVDASRMLGEDGVANADAYGKALRQWGISAEDGIPALDSLFKLTQDYGISLSGLTGTLSAYGAVLQNAGFEMEEAAVLFAQMSAGGISVSRVMPALNASFRRWASEGKNSREELLKIVQTIRDTEDSQKALALATEVFGAQGAQRLMTAIRQGIVTFDDFGEALDGAAGSIENTARETESFGEKWTRIKNRVLVGLEPIATRVFDGVGKAMDRLAPHVETVTKGIEEFVSVALKSLSDWWNVNGPGIVEFFTTVGGWVADNVLPVLAKLADVIVNDLVPGLFKIAQWVIDNKPVLIGVAVAIATLLVPAFIAWAAAAGAAALATLKATLPIVAIAAAIAALVAGVIYAYNEWDWFRTAVDKVADFFTDVLWPALKKVADFIANTLMPKVVEFGGWLRDRLAPIVSAVASWFADTLWPALKKVADFIKNTVIPTIGDIISWLARIGGTIKGVASDLWGFVVDVYRAFGDVLDFVRSLPGRVADAVRGIWDGLKRGVKEAVEWVLEQLDRLFGPLDDIVGKVGSLLGKGAGAAKGVWNTITSFDTGGVIGGGRKGDPQLVLAHVGETVLPTHRMSIVDALTEVGIGPAARGGNTYVLNTTVVESHATVAQQFRRMELAAGFA